MVNYIYKRVAAYDWLSPSVPGSPRGVLLRRDRGVYVTKPYNIDPMLLAAVQKLNCTVAFTFSTQTTLAVAGNVQPDETEIVLPDGFQLQVIDSLADIVNSGSNFVKKFQYGAFLRQEQIVLVWHDDLEMILAQASHLEDKLLGLVWGSTFSPFQLPSSYESRSASRRLSSNSIPVSFKEKAIISSGTEVPASPDAYGEEEKGQKGAKSKKDKKAYDPNARPVKWTSSLNTAIGMALILVLILGFGVANITFETLTDGTYTRFALFATIPLFLVLSIFFAIVLVSDVFRTFGPITNVRTNSRFFSAIAPDVPLAYSKGFRPPHITIQMPVYKESLEGVIVPTLRSLKAAISHYESHGGSASVFVNDDGLAFLSDQERQARIDFYHDNNVGWVARPAHGDNGFERKGKFKKASNMNFCLNVSCKVEKQLLQLVANRMVETNSSDYYLDSREEEEMYYEALHHVLKTDPRAQAGGNIRVGEIILIVDSDTRVPDDCLLLGAAEMFLSPEVAIIQHSTGVMQVAHDYFENGITFFTTLIYSSIRFAVANGEVSAFVGHNAFISWAQLQSVGVVESNGYVAYWSECHVSEDFDVALRLQNAGSIIRLATYHNDDFKEGVSLTIYDELNRWEKYAYGCNELVFNPIHTWLWRGPFTKLFGAFMFGNMHLSSKITILGYISSYYAIASSFPMTILNYFLTGWFLDDLDKWYMPSWQIFLSVILVFSIIGNLSLAILRYRLAEKGLWEALFENFKWMPFFSLFFGGISFHISLALLAHMTGIGMSWGATTKEVENSNFFREMPKIWSRFKWMYLVIWPLVGGMLYLGIWAPVGWRIQEVISVVPLAVMLVCHALVPFVLNPSEYLPGDVGGVLTVAGIMVFNY
ncbi:hypothetical protein BT63DRAFT_466148 [Microthyrium microscopicum]|uniref:Uncharacterized protein n=1 Tax=Microthyrium microscopicum TaxID=703497 RepID=A0A6A6UMB6_9PEZI|nr:hypothetical protein BT63DRAFT_466148 [Microthyrium microscopicum]